jgi:hypothetical protein
MDNIIVRDNNFVCKQCIKVFVNEKAYLYHMKIHTNPVCCPHCDKKFSGITFNYRTHVATHTKELKFNCKYCEETFISNTNLTRHFLKTHPENIDKMREYRAYSSLPSFYRQFTFMNPIDMLILAADVVNNQ